MRRILLLSDVHLSCENSITTNCFLEFLHNIDCDSVSSLYILGDLFDVWLGDDVQTAVAEKVQEALRTLSDGGIAIFIQHGNRDFMLGMRFMNRVGATLLPTAHVLEDNNKRWLLMHGDSLVTDASYLRYRRIIRQPLLLALASALPLSWRHWLAAKMRAASRGNSESAVLDDSRTAAVLRHHGCKQLVHGHLHKSGDYVWNEDGMDYQRWCLPAWEEEGGGYAEISAGQLTINSYS